jgi:hypothetical protein
MARTISPASGLTDLTTFTYPDASRRHSPWPTSSDVTTTNTRLPSGSAAANSSPARARWILPRWEPSLQRPGRCGGWPFWVLSRPAGSPASTVPSSTAITPVTWARSNTVSFAITPTAPVIRSSITKDTPIARSQARCGATVLTTPVPKRWFGIVRAASTYRTGIPPARPPATTPSWRKTPSYTKPLSSSTPRTANTSSKFG